MRDHTHPFNGPLSRTNWVSRYQTGKTNLDFTRARDSEGQWQWHQLDHMQVCTSLQTDNHASTPPLSFLQARCPSCRPTNSVKALKAKDPIDPICISVVKTPKWQKGGSGEQASTIPYVVGSLVTVVSSSMLSGICDIW